MRFFDMVHEGDEGEGKVGHGVVEDSFWRSGLRTQSPAHKADGCYATSKLLTFSPNAQTT
jgi:hypothetical protein